MVKKYAIILHETRDISRWNVHVQWRYVKELYYVHSSCHFMKFYNLHNFCGKSFQAPVNYVMKTIWAEVDSIDRRVGKKDSFTNHFPSEILKQIFIKQFNIQSNCKINIVVKVFNQNDKCSIFENIVTVRIVILLLYPAIGINV